MLALIAFSSLWSSLASAVAPCESNTNNIYHGSSVAHMETIPTIARLEHSTAVAYFQPCVANCPQAYLPRTPHHAAIFSELLPNHPPIQLKRSHKDNVELSPNVEMSSSAPNSNTTSSATPQPPNGWTSWAPTVEVVVTYTYRAFVTGMMIVDVHINRRHHGE